MKKTLIRISGLVSMTRNISKDVNKEEILIKQPRSLSSCVFLSRFKDHGHERRMEILDLYRGMELARAVTQRPSLFSHWSSGLTTIEFNPA
ncbi:hypothetical protein T10_1060 [Trichinella papuae]|uniref:Uncharacterized protein n=1 Tax=Trichinella papuae TaxID=268474 RepID=A0A0V1N384_9BILA|nr:hypothetical protein T10_1060 [Trichinella papuae]